MNELSIYERSQLPDQPSDLVKFVVIAQEKAKALRAEIQAIKKLELAKDVYEQKLEELARLNELVIIAKNRVGEFTSQLPAHPGMRTDKQPLPTAGNRFDGTQKPKAQIIKELGLSTSQVNRFEKMAANPDIVENVLSESRAGVTEATQGEVMRRIEEKEKIINIDSLYEEERKAVYAQISEDAKRHKEFVSVVYTVLKFIGSEEDLEAVTDSIVRSAEGNVRTEVANINSAINILAAIQAKIIEKGGAYGKKQIPGT